MHYHGILSSPNNHVIVTPNSRRIWKLGNCQHTVFLQKRETVNVLRSVTLNISEWFTGWSFSKVWGLREAKRDCWPNAPYLMAQPVCDVLVNGSNNVPAHHNIRIIHASASSAESQRIAHQTSRSSTGISIYYFSNTAEVLNHYIAKLACHKYNLKLSRLPSRVCCHQHQ